MASADSLLVNEIYPCLQGEGPSLGRPSVLLRLQICNLRCTWCDTPYTHTRRSDPTEEGSTKQRFQRLSIGEVCSQIRKHTHIRNVIVSGGEPTLQNFSALPNILGDQYTLEVETNGTQIPHRLHPSFSQNEYAAFQWNVSPKGEAAGEKIVPIALEHWATLAQQHEKVFFKFVIRSDFLSKDIADVRSIQNDFKLSPQRIFLMPEGTTQDSQVGNVSLHNACLELGYRYTPRLHVLFFGNGRGV